MKTKCDKSSVMEKAWSTKKGRNGWMFTFSQCLTWAWKNEKKRVKRWNDDEDRRNHTGEYLPAKIAERKAQIKTSVCDMSFMADTLISYYANNCYNGDPFKKANHINKHYNNENKK
ncbi:MAG: hypothetical protein LBU37_01465 [Tannerellaceae bacterium]|jgi:hypothetical protein|nr:hypothetical protein [Tannerellaceae bacterium]